MIHEAARTRREKLQWQSISFQQTYHSRPRRGISVKNNGKVPNMKLSVTSKKTKFVSNPISVGIVPVSCALAKLKVTNLVSKPISVGIVPWGDVAPIHNASKSVRRPRWEDSVPPSSLLANKEGICTSQTTHMFLLALHRRAHTQHGSAVLARRRHWEAVPWEDFPYTFM